MAVHPDNEFRSAEIFRDFAGDVGLPKRDTDVVASWIERTAYHMKGPAKGDLAWFLDFDLAILGSEPSKYSECEPPEL